MRIKEATQKTVAIYPGRFHPFHKGHASVYNFLKSKFDNVFITTSNKIDPPKSPFSFEEKRAMMVHAGIPASAIVQARQPYIPVEVLQNFDPKNTSVVFAVSQKDMEEDPRFAFKPKKDGSPSYFQPATGADMQTFDKHGYVMVAPTLNFTVLGEPMKSATEFRRDFASADNEKQQAMITDLYGSYSEQIHNIMRNKIKEHADPYLQHVLAAESVLHDLSVLYEHRAFDMSHVALNAQKIIDKINTIPVVETLDYLDPNDPMDSIVAVPGVGTMSIRGLMSNIKDKMSELADKAGSGQPSAFRDIKYRLDSNIIGVMVDALANAFDDIENIRRKGGKNSAGIPKNVFDSVMHFHEAWSAKYKRSINCNNPKGFSQRAHCAGRKKTESTVSETIRKQGNKYVIYSKDGKKKLGTYDSRKAAEKRLRQIEYFKHNESINESVITEYVFQSIPLRVLDNLASRKDNKPFPIKTGPDSTFDVTPETARKFMSVYLRKEPEVQKAIDKTLADPRKFIDLFTDIMAGKTRSGAKVTDVAPDKVQELKIEKPDAADTMGIERIKMPQVAKDDYAEYLDYLKDAGASFTKETVPAKSLRAMQKEFSDAGILKQMQRDPSGKQKPLIASSDDYIIDGHHRWLVAVNTGQSLPIYRVNMPGAELLTLTLNFPKVSFKSIYESAGVGIIDKQNTTADVKPGETERQSKKLGLGGKPKLLHKTAAKNSDPNKLFNLGLAEIYTPLAIAIMEGGHELPNFAEVDEGAIDDIISINKKLQAQRDAREAGLKDKLIKMLLKARGLPRGSNKQVELIKDMNKIRKQLLMDPIAIPESVENAEQLEAYEINGSLVDKFLKATGGKYGKRDQCGPACIDFISWAKKQGIELKRVRGEFVADEVVSAKADFTPEMKKEFMQSGLDWNSSADRKAWIEQSKYAEEWKRVPHYWTVDKDGNIHDPSGYQQLVKTGLAKDLDPSRYIHEGVNEADDNDDPLEGAAGDWLVMMFDNNDIETILNAPNQFKQAPNTNSIYRAIFKDRNVQKENAKSTAKFIPYSTSIAGAQTYVHMSDNPGPYYIIEKKFNPSDMLVNFQSIVEHYDLLIPQNWEDEVWMKRTPYYTKSTKNEIVFDSEGNESIQEEKDYMRGYCHVWALKDVKANPERELYARIGHHYDDDSEEVDHIFTVDKNTGKAYDVRGEFANADALLADYDFGADEVEVVKITADDIQDWCDIGELKPMDEGAEITMWTNPEYQGSDVDDEYYNKQPAKLIDVNKLTPHEPADKMDDEISAANMNRLVKAIQAGQKINPIVVVPHKGKLLIIDGHHRYFATIKAGVDKIRVVMADPKDLTWRNDVPINEAVSQVDIDQLERFADKMFAKVGIDVEFGRHFMDRVNDERNGKPITPAELTRLFKQEYKRYGKPIAQMGPEQQAVMKDLQTDINIPFMLQWDADNNELDLIAKTVMRKKDFKTSNREFAVERGGINVPFASGMIAQIVPHRALKVKKSTPGRLSYDQPETKRKRNK